MNNDIKQLCLDILRDTYASSRRLAMYPLGHPTTQETLKKPLSDLNEIFVFKHSFVIELFRGRLLAEGILLEDSVFVSGMALEMKKHKLTNIIFGSNVAIGDLYHFLSTLVAKPGPYEDNVARILNAKNIISIKVNVENAPSTFNFDTTIQSPRISQYFLDERIKEILGERPGIIGLYYMGRVKNDDEVLNELGIDFRLSFLTKYFRDSLVGLDRERGLSLLEQTILATNWLDDSINSQTVLGLKRLFDDFLSDNRDEEVISRIYKLLKKIGTPDAVMNQIFNKSSFLKLKALQESESMVETLRSADATQIDPASIKKTVFKLAASGQKEFLQDLLDQLIRSLSSQSLDHRRQAAMLIGTAAEVLANGGFFDEFGNLCKDLIRLSLLPTDTIEPVEITSDLLLLAIKNNRWREFKALASTLRGVCDDKLQADIKRELASGKLDEVSSSRLLFVTASNLSEQGRIEEAFDFFEGLSALGSKEVIRMLAGRLTHPDINVRSRMIKLLVAMKRDSGSVLTEILEQMISGVTGGVITEEEWYYFRNILRVLKEVRAEEALPQLEIMIAWPIPRIKLEVIKTLEGMPGEATAEILLKLCLDDNIEVRKAAIVALGLVSDNSAVPHLREIFMKDPACRLVVVATLGRIGSGTARDLLIELFEDKELYRSLDIPRKDSDEIRATILKALSIIGDPIAMRKLAEYSNMSFDKSLFKKDLLSNTAKIILGGKAR